MHTLEYNKAVILFVCSKGINGARVERVMELVNISLNKVNCCDIVQTVFLRFNQYLRIFSYF